MTHDDSDWLRAGRDLVVELTRSGKIGLITGHDDDVQGLVQQLCDELGLDVVSVGRAMANHPNPPSIDEIEARISGDAILDDIGLLFSPPLHTNVLAFLKSRAKQWVTIAVWPGEIDRGRAVYSVPGRLDHQDSGLSDVVILRPIHTRFPDEAPFTIERISR